VIILCSKSYAQLRATFEEYESLAGHSIEEGLKKEFSGDLLNSFNSIVQCVRDKQSYFASLLYKSMHGAGTKESMCFLLLLSFSFEKPWCIYFFELNKIRPFDKSRC